MVARTPTARHFCTVCTPTCRDCAGAWMTATRRCVGWGWLQLHAAVHGARNGTNTHTRWLRWVGLGRVGWVGWFVAGCFLSLVFFLLCFSPGVSHDAIPSFPTANANPTRGGACGMPPLSVRGSAPFIRPSVIQVNVLRAENEKLQSDIGKLQHECVRGRRVLCGPSGHWADARSLRGYRPCPIQLKHPLLFAPQ
jgi:hypothetical protein